MEIVKQNWADAEITKRVILLLGVSSPRVVAHLQMALKTNIWILYSVKQNDNK